MKGNKKYVIWSIEHQGWWRAGKWGYADNVSEAGQYDEDEAREILRNANIVDVRECLIPVAALAVFVVVPRDETPS